MVAAVSEEWHDENERDRGFHSSQQGAEIRKPIQRGSIIIIIGLEGVLESVLKGKSMNRKMVRTITLGTFALVAVLCAARPGRAADAKTPYPSMAPLDQHLMADRDPEIALARSAAPPPISSDSTASVLSRHGYGTAVKDNNGSVCSLECAWKSRLDTPARR